MYFCPVLLVGAFSYSVGGQVFPKGKDGSGSGFGSWKTVPAVPVLLSVSGKMVPTVPVSGFGSVPEPPCNIRQEKEKRSKKQGIPRRGKEQGIPKKQGKEGQGVNKYELFGPVALETTLGLSLGRPRVCLGTNPLCPRNARLFNHNFKLFFTTRICRHGHADLLDLKTCTPVKGTP